MSALVRLVHAIDVLDWAGVRAVLGDRVLVDYTSLGGGEPAEVSGDDLVTTWQGLLPGFGATQHLLGPVVVTGEREEAHVRGYHHLDGSVWMIAGHYAAEVRGDRIAALRLDTYYQDGDLDLPARATARIARGEARSAIG